MRGRKIAVAGDDGIDESPEGFGGQGLGFGAEQEAGRGLVLLHELEGVEVVGRGEYPGGKRGGGWCVGGDVKVGVGGQFDGNGVWCGYEDRLIGEGGGEVGEGSSEGSRGERTEADEQCGCGGRLRSGVLGDGGGGSHGVLVARKS